jgi:flavodoxin I
MTMLVLLLWLLPSAVLSFTAVGQSPRRSSSSSSSSVVALEAVAVFFGTSTGSTQEAAELIASKIPDAVGPIDIDSIKKNLAEEFAKYDALVVGTPTWNTGADTERSGVGWDEVYYRQMQKLSLPSKKVAVFGLGDSISYSDNYADATGELHDVFQSLGCTMMGYTSQEGYEHKSSKAIRGDLFCGLLLDAVNQEDLTEQRVEAWVEQLTKEGFMNAAVSTSASTPQVVVVAAAAVAPAAPPAMMPVVVNGAPPNLDQMMMIAKKLEEENAALRLLLEQNSKLLDDTIHDGFVPYANTKTGRTMWVSADGRSCYYAPSQRVTTASP